MRTARRTHSLVGMTTLVLIASVLSACDNPELSSVSAGSSTADDQSVVGQAQDPEPTAPAGSAPQPTAPNRESGQCSTRDLYSTDFGQQSGNTVVENLYDSCSPLSWVVAADGGASIVLFNEGNEVLRSGPADTIIQVERTGTSSIVVTWTKDGQTFETTYRWDGSLLIDGPALPSPTQTTETVSEQAELPAGRYALAIAPNQNLLCTIGTEGVIADCYADFPTTWKMNDDEHRQATRITYTSPPDQVRASNDPNPDQDYQPVSGIATIAGVHVNLETQHEAFISPNGQRGVRITPDSYELMGAGPGR